LNFAETLLPLLPTAGGLVAFVGAGGKTRALFSLGEALTVLGGPVLLSCTTHLLDPRLEAGRPPLTLLLRPDLEGPESALPLPAAQPGLSLLMARVEPPEKLKGIHPSWLPALRTAWPHILVEADGSKRLPLKAPADHEPVLPPQPDLVVGVLGLDGLGRPLDDRSVHRSEVFSQITGCAPGVPIRWEHLAALVGHPLGLFKGAPGCRVLLLNKVDRAPFLPTREQLAALPADWILLGALEGPERGMVMVKGIRP